MTEVNEAITDAVTQNNVKVVSESSAMAMANLYMSMSQGLSNAAHNATTAQQNANTILQTTTTMGVTTLYGVDTEVTAEGIATVLNATT